VQNSRGLIFPRTDCRSELNCFLRRVHKTAQNSPESQPPAMHCAGGFRLTKRQAARTDGTARTEMRAFLRYILVHSFLSVFVFIVMHENQHILHLILCPVHPEYFMNSN
jgi:hypothetical protein